jgi:hypothetical protein
MVPHAVIGREEKRTKPKRKPATSTTYSVQEQCKDLSWIVIYEENTIGEARDDIRDYGDNYFRPLRIVREVTTFKTVATFPAKRESSRKGTP